MDGMGGGGMGGGGMMAPGDFVGGKFWDRRATGWLLGDPLAEQATGPFLNPLEQNNPNAKHVCLAVRESGEPGREANRPRGAARAARWQIRQQPPGDNG